MESLNWPMVKLTDDTENIHSAYLVFFSLAHEHVHNNLKHGETLNITFPINITFIYKNLEKYAYFCSKHYTVSHAREKAQF